VFFFSSGGAISGVSIVFFQSCRRSVACPPEISVLDVQVLETSNVLAYINFRCVV
jgi:hypothetical protein